MREGQILPSPGKYAIPAKDWSVMCKWWNGMAASKRAKLTADLHNWNRIHDHWKSLGKPQP